MIISLVSQEKNIGILTLSDYLLGNFGKNNTEMVGWSYLISDYKKLLEKIEEIKKSKNVIIKYIIPKQRFSNQGISYPKELDEISDIVFKVPSYLEEIAPNPALVFFKGGDLQQALTIRNFYLLTVGGKK